MVYTTWYTLHFILSSLAIQHLSHPDSFLQPYQYLKADAPFLDKMPYSRLGVYGDSAELVLPADCSQNLMALLCNTWFKQCSQVEDDKTGQLIWLPALMCQHDCENYISVWDECVATLQEDVDSYEKFKLQMAIMGDRGIEIVNKDRFDKLVTPVGGWYPFEPLRCNVTGGVMADIEPANAVNAYMFGQYPVRCLLYYNFILYVSFSHGGAFNFPKFVHVYFSCHTEPSLN